MVVGVEAVVCGSDAKDLAMNSTTSTPLELKIALHKQRVHRNSLQKLSRPNVALRASNVH
jgi:hypothetical protein